MLDRRQAGEKQECQGSQTPSRLPWGQWSAKNANMYIENKVDVSSPPDNSYDCNASWADLYVGLLSSEGWAYSISELPIVGGKRCVSWAGKGGGCEGVILKRKGLTAFTWQPYPTLSWEPTAS